jgi:alkanesulfonate monooxygenase SsuD/methylene tetrahydromethanopterin reductase-like flavin-dependent oxidoreductase (luciferase family)
MFDEVVGEFHKMWRAEEYAGFDGRFFSMPPRNVLPKPFSQPHPPMWVAAGNPATFEKAARMGLGVLCFTIGGPESVKPLIDLYKKEIEKAEPVGDFVNDNVAVTTSFMCLEDRDEARELLTHSGNGRQQSLVFHYLDTFPKPPGIPDWPEEIPDPTLDQIDKGFASGASIVGTPDDCAEALQKWEDVGVDQLIMGPSGSVFPHELLARTIALFGDEVIPRFDKDPEHSTSRYRRQAAERLGV